LEFDVTNDSKTRSAPTKAQQDAVFQRLMDLGRGFQPDLYDVAGEVCLMLNEAQAAGSRGAEWTAR